MENEVVDLAPEDKIWVCPHCGKHNKDRHKVGDVSCYMNAMLCDEEQQEIEGTLTWIYNPNT